MTRRIHDSLRKDEYYMKRKFLSPNTIYVRDESGDLALYCDGKESMESEKKMTMNIYAEESMMTKLLRVTTEQFLEEKCTYIVQDVRNHQTIGSLKREEYGRGKEWTFLTTEDEEMAKFKAESTTWVILNAMRYCPTRYVISSDDHIIATLTRSWIPFVNRYKLQIKSANLQIDRELIIVMAVLMEASV